MYAVLSMLTKTKSLGFNKRSPSVEEPRSANLGAKFAGNVIKNFPPSRYEPSKKRNAMAREVYTIPIIPTIENGPNALSDFIKESGNKATIVTPNKAWVLVTPV
jgi:hypothetical protein